MAKNKSFLDKIKELPWKKIAVGGLVLGIGILGGAGVTLTVKNGEDGEVIVEASTTAKIELTETTVPAIIETGEGTQNVEVPTVEAVDSKDIEECSEGEECGKGWYVDTSSYEAFRNATLGNCIDTDGYYGSQCWDLGNLFWQNYAGRTLSTCGTGAAKGTLICYEENAGSEFEMVWNVTELQPGDWVVFTNGEYGHIGMAMGSYNNGYISLLGTNQGGAACYGGGAATNIINISLKNFGGAFRPKSYIQPKTEPVQEEVQDVSGIPMTGCIEWGVQHGDTMSKIMLECENTVVYGEAMNDYAKTWFSRYVKPGQSVYEGWTTGTGYGLYAGDTIDHKVGQ